jgi:hypothetical protein
MTQLFYRLNSKNQAVVLTADEGCDIPVNNFYEFLDTVDVSNSVIDIIEGDCERTIISLESAELLNLETDGARIQEANDEYSYED